MKKKVVILDGDESSCNGLKRILSNRGDFELIAIYSFYYELIFNLTLDRPDIILVRLDDSTYHLETVTDITKSYRDIKILLIIKNYDESTITAALRSGAHGLLTMDINSKNLMKAIKIVLSGGAYLSPGIINLLVSSYKSNPDSPLTMKETEVVQHLVEGNTYRQIGEIIGISKETVKSHLKNVYKKIKVNRKSDLISHVKKNRLLK